MPSYLMKCNACQKDYEFVSTMAECHLVPNCPECDSRNVQRNYAAEQAYLTPPIKTVGSYADTHTISLDEEKHRQNERIKERAKFQGPWKKT